MNEEHEARIRLALSGGSLGWRTAKAISDDVRAGNDWVNYVKYFTNESSEIFHKVPSLSGHLPTSRVRPAAGRASHASSAAKPNRHLAVVTENHGHAPLPAAQA